MTTSLLFMSHFIYSETNADALLVGSIQDITFYLWFLF